MVTGYRIAGTAQKTFVSQFAMLELYIIESPQLFCNVPQTLKSFILRIEFSFEIFAIEQ